MTIKKKMYFFATFCFHPECYIQKDKKGERTMKKSSALLLVAVLMISGSCSNVGSSGTRTVFTTIPDTSDDPEPAGTTVTGAFDLPEWDISFLLDITDNHPDKLYRNDEYDAELLVFRTGDTYFTYSTEEKWQAGRAHIRKSRLKWRCRKAALN